MLKRTNNTNFLCTVQSSWQSRTRPHKLSFQWTISKIKGQNQTNKQQQPRVKLVHFDNNLKGKVYKFKQ